jgi:ketosteroid isomerase-like protein
MRKLLIGGAVGVLVALAALVISLAAFGGSSTSSTTEQTMQRRADLWAIDQIEKNFHRATSKHDIDLMMRLWAPNATLTVGPGQTAAGKQKIRQFWLNKSVAFEPTNRWVSETPAYKVRITVNGDRGTLHFECHYIDVKTKKLVVAVAADQEVARINGKWLITDMVAQSATLSP